MKKKLLISGVLSLFALGLLANSKQASAFITPGAPVGGGTSASTSINGLTNASYTFQGAGSVSISTSTPNVITVTGSGSGSNNATGTIDEQTLFNATNTLISSQPDYVPANFATAGCAGSSTATTINGCIQAIAAQEQANGASAATIVITNNVPSSTYQTPINLATNGFPVQLECTAGVTLSYSGVTNTTKSGAIIFNFGNPTGHPVIMEGAGCNFLGRLSWIAAGQTNNATTTGAYIGGSNGAVGIVLAANFNGFGKNYEVGQNAYMFNFVGTSSGGNGGVQTYTGSVGNGTAVLTGLTNASNIPIGAYITGTSIPNNTQVIGTTSSTVTMNQNGTATSTSVTMTVNFGSLAQWDFANNSGERALAVGGTYTDPGNSSATNALYVANGAVADIHILQNAIDDAHIYCGSSDGLCDIESNHEENSDSSQYGTYHLVTNPSSDLSTLIVYKNNEIANDTSGANSLGTLIVHGGQLQMSGNILNNYGGGTVPALADHSNDNGLEGESICGNTVSGGTLTNIVAGGGGNTYSQAASLGCSIDVANSFTINIFPNSNNVNDITSGNSLVGTFDHNGNWTLGIAGISGSLNVQGNVNASGTVASTGNITDGGTLSVTGASTLKGVTEALGTQYYSLFASSTASTAATTVNWNNSNVQELQLTTSTVLSFSNTNPGARYILMLLQDATGSRTVTWPSSVQWASGTAPTLTTAANKLDIVTFVCAGVSSTDCYGGANLNYTP